MQEARRCQYTGLLYCASCHTGETARIPALVLHSWDFRKQPVCCLAAQYLAAIHDQPLLDVSAISPGALPNMPGCMDTHQERSASCWIHGCVRLAQAARAQAQHGRIKVIGSQGRLLPGMASLV